MQDEICDQLADALWQALAQKPLSEITLQGLAQAHDIPYEEAVMALGDVTGGLLHKLARLDREALATSLRDFADDPQASIYEKLLEGLMMRFEMLAPHRAQFEALHVAAKTAPALAAHLLHQLSDTVGKLLVLAGDDSTGFLKQARIIGVVGVLLRVRPVWIQDDGRDLGLTLKKLDDDLKRACEWAVSLRVLSEADVKGGHSDE